MVVLGILLSFSSAWAAEPVEIQFTKESAREWVHALHGLDEDAVCTAYALRPGSKDPAMITESNRIECKVASQDQPLVSSLNDALVDMWGGRMEASFTIQSGSLLDRILPIFREKTRGTLDTPREGEMWSRITICDPNGNICLQSLFLNGDGRVDSAAQVACSIESELSPILSMPLLNINPQDYSTIVDYYDDVIEAQIKAGVRIIVRRNCVFIGR